MTSNDEMDRVLLFSLIYAIRSVSVSSLFPWVPFLALNNVKVFRVLLALSVCANCAVAVVDSTVVDFTLEGTLALAVLAPFCHKHGDDDNSVVEKP